MKTFQPQSLLSTLLSLLMAIIAWFAIAPTQLGGQVTYIIVDGNSMEPKFHFGDLVLVRKQSIYQAGEAVTYQDAEMGQYVFHRIVNIQGDRFILQGDHNTWLDSYHPKQSEIIGRLWIHIPMAGKPIQWARKPLGLAIICGLLGGIMLTDMILHPSSKRKRNNKRPSRVGGLVESGSYFFGFMAVLSLALTIFAFTRPLTRPAENIPYQQDSYFMYSAAGTEGVYDSNTIQPGEPIFPKLTCILNVGIAYNVTGNGLQSVTGSHQLSARVLDEKSGWQRTLPLDSETSFRGNSYSTQAALDLCQIEALVASVEEQTGLHPNMYTLELVAHTNVTGNLISQPLSDSLDSVLKFQFDKVNFHLISEATASDPLHTSKSGSISSLTSTPGMFRILGIALTVQSVRVLGLFGLGLSVIGFLLTGLYFLQGAKSDPAELIRLKYRGRLMEVRGVNLQQNQQFVDVASMDDLARLAERQSTMITHMKLNSQHYYLVQINAMIYRYLLGASTTSANDLGQTQPRIYLPERIKSSHIDAIPIDTEQVTYRVEFNQTRYTPADEDRSVLLHRVKL